MKIEVSIGEAIDKLSILELKRKFIEDEKKLAEIEKEIISLEDCNQYKNIYYDILNYVNEKIWHLTNKIKSMSFSDNSDEFSSVANEIFEFNQKRFRIKNLFNLAQNSSIREQKSYDSKTARIILSSSSEIYDKIAEIMALTIEYDFLFIDFATSSTSQNFDFATSPTPQNFDFTTDRDSASAAAKNILKRTHFYAFNSGIISMATTETPETSTVIKLSEISLFEILWSPKDVAKSKFCGDSQNRSKIQELYRIFELKPIAYRTCGMFGDYIHQLSVINETFLETGRKGIIYFSDAGHPFRNGVEQTFNDTYEVIIKQPYVKEYKIHNNEHYDVCLSAWRNHLSNDSWNDIFKRTYNVDWGRHIWLDIQYDEKWKNTIIINHNECRPTAYMTADDAVLLENYANDNIFKLVFLTYNIEEFYGFKNRFNVLSLEHFCPSSFLDMSTAIRSCHFFIGCLSGPLTIAHACRTPCLVLLRGFDEDDNRESKMADIWDNVYFTMKDVIYKMSSDNLKTK